ncbi:MAG: hypothetical protein ACXWIS_10290 [Burkholderiales bacterium]
MMHSTAPGGGGLGVGVGGGVGTEGKHASVAELLTPRNDILKAFAILRSFA